MLKLLFAVLSISLLSSPLALEIKGIKVPSTVKVGNKELILNGAGTRRGTFLNVKVYIGALYLSKKSRIAANVLNQPFPKYVSMTFLRDANKEDLVGAWKEGFSAAVPKEKQKALLTDFNKFLEKIGGIKKKEQILLTFLDEGVIVSFNGKKYPAIGNKDFAQALFSIWFVNPADESLRDELLGNG